METEHYIGDGRCYREVIKHPPPRKISCEKDRWLVQGDVITGTTLREQRLYHQHTCGKWSRPVGGISENSISA